MNVVDSSAWLEYFAAGPNAEFFTPAIEDVERLIVPSIVLYEVFKRILQQRGERQALDDAGQMGRATVIGLDMQLALKAAKISLELKLPLADAAILAAAQAYRATLWTQDADFQGVDGVQYISRRPVH